MKTLGANKLFTATQVGSMELEHRVGDGSAYTLEVRSAWEYSGDLMTSTIRNGPPKVGS